MKFSMMFFYELVGVPDPYPDFDNDDIEELMTVTVNNLPAPLAGSGVERHDDYVVVTMDVDKADLMQSVANDLPGNLQIQFEYGGVRYVLNYTINGMDVEITDDNNDNNYRTAHSDITEDNRKLDVVDY